METNQKDFKAARQLQDANLKKSWYKQAFLMNYMYPLCRPLIDKLNPSKFIKMVSPGSNNIINRLTMSDDVMTFLEGTPVQYAQLVPQIEVYKIFIKDKKRVSEVLLPFPAYTDFQKDWASASSTLLAAPFRGRDVGIESVELKMDGVGKNPFAAQMMRVTLKLVFNDIKTLFREWTDKDGQRVQYADLIRHSPTVRSGDTKAESVPAAFQIRLSVGWGFNENNPIFTESQRGKLFASAARNSRMNFIGTLSKHDMTFTEDGAVKITASYEGALEASMSSVNSDILQGYSIENENINKLKAELARIELVGGWSDENKKFSGNAGEYRSLKEAKAMVDKLKVKKAKVDALVKSAKGDQTYVDVRPPIQKDYDAIMETGAMSSNAAQAALKSALDAAVKGISLQGGGMVQAADASMINAAEQVIDEQIQKQRHYAQDLKDQRRQILQGIQALEANMRVRTLFGHIEQLVKSDRVAWINMHQNKAFESYTEYRDSLLKAAKAKRENDEAGQELAEQDAVDAAQTAQVEAQSTQPPADPPIDLKESVQSMGDKLQPTGVIKTLCFPDGGKQIIETYKKIGGEANLFSSDLDTKGEKLMFFMLGDLITAILNSGDLGESLENQVPGFRMILGNIEYGAPMANNTVMASLYCLPISLEVFTRFLAKKVVGTGRPAYPLIQFIRDLVKFVVKNVGTPSGLKAAGNAMVNPTSNRRFKLNLTPCALPKKFLEGAPYEIDLNAGNKENYNAAKRIPINKLSNVFLLTPYTENPAKARALSQCAEPEGCAYAQPLRDKEEGIPHFIVGGPQQGILKSINFTEETDPDMAMSLMRDASKDPDLSGRGIITPKNFRCQVKLVGNPYFYVGQQFYVNTSLISANRFAPEKIMNGGYYMVLSVDTTLSSGRWETNLTGMLVLSDIAIIQGRKEKAKKPTNKFEYVPPLKKQEIKNNQQQAEQQKTDAVKGVPTTKPPPTPCVPKGQQC